MKKIGFLGLILVPILLSACSVENDVSETQLEDINIDVVQDNIVDSSDMINEHELLAYASSGDLSDEERDSLLQMRQEEMLARDVYDFLYEKWGQKTFDNISDSEQTHMNTVGYLLDKYGIEDPIDASVPGIYQSKELQDIYNSLIEQGSKSLLDALIVGATVEDLDIKDLQDFLLDVDNEDIVLAYQNLMKGSRNHLRSFVKQVDRNGGKYVPQFITQEDYDYIIGDEQENYMIDSSGRNIGGGRHK